MQTRVVVCALVVLAVALTAISAVDAQRVEPRKRQGGVAAGTFPRSQRIRDAPHVQAKPAAAATRGKGKPAAAKPRRRYAPTKPVPSRPGAGHPKLKPIGGLVKRPRAPPSAVAVVAGVNAAAARAASSSHRFASLMRRDKMEVALKGWIADFFSYFENAVNILTEKVKTYVLNTVNAFEDRAVVLFNSIDALWTYFTAGKNGITQQVADLWVNVRCDVCQSALVHIYQKGCAYAAQGICELVDWVACGSFKPVCDRFLCPIIQKLWLQPECANIMSRLDAALLSKQTGTYSPLDNFNSLAVCKRVGFCRAMDKPLDGTLLNAIVQQAKRLTAAEAASTKAPAEKLDDAFDAATAGVSSVPIPSQRQKQPGMYYLPGLRTTISAWLNNQYNSPKYGKPYYMFWKPDSTAMPGVKELWWLNKINGKPVADMGIAGVLNALSGQPGTTADLEFEDSGFFGSSFPVKRVRFVAWPVDYAAVQREKVAAK